MNFHRPRRSITVGRGPPREQLTGVIGWIGGRNTVQIQNKTVPTTVCAHLTLPPQLLTSCPALTQPRSVETEDLIGIEWKGTRNGCRALSITAETRSTTAFEETILNMLL